VLLTASPNEADLRRFIDEHRSRCLWFLREDYYPATVDQRREVLRQIEQHGDRQAFQQAAQFRAWLSQHSSETSAAT
jgi:hypothetical protein